jgi:D-amino-acid oxidase
VSEIIVIGSGVIGLSSARCLQNSGYSVRILTREMPLKTTSVAAGAVWSGSALEGSSRDWAAASLRYFLPLTQQPGSGVILQRMREVYTEAVPAPWYRDLLPAFSRLAARDLPAGLVDGYLMDVPMIAPPIYLQALQDQFLAVGGVIEARVVDSLDEAATEADLLVNCSGIGARRLADDAAVYPMRGQTLLIDAPDIALGYMDNERVDHIFPRADGVLIGGVKLDGDWKRQLDPAISADIIRRTSKIESGIAQAQVRREFAGLRPGRAQVRLELEQRPSGKTIIHNYGHGSVGYTLSWGCAEAVAALARNLL